MGIYAQSASRECLNQIAPNKLNVSIRRGSNSAGSADVLLRGDLMAAA